MARFEKFLQIAGLLADLATIAGFILALLS